MYKLLEFVSHGSYSSFPSSRQEPTPQARWPCSQQTIAQWKKKHTHTSSLSLNSTWAAQECFVSTKYFHKHHFWLSFCSWAHLHLGPLHQLLLLSTQSLHAYLLGLPMSPRISHPSILLYLTVCNHCAEKGIKAQNLKFAQDHCSGVAIASNSDIFWHIKKFKTQLILSYKRFK